MMKKLLMSVLFAGLSFSGNAFADNYEGKITNINVNPTITDRGVCVQMEPALPTTEACLWKSAALYDEMTSIILAARVSGITCKITSWGVGPNGFRKIDVIQC